MFSILHFIGKVLTGKLHSHRQIVLNEIQSYSVFRVSGVFRVLSVQWKIQQNFQTT